LSSTLPLYSLLIHRPASSTLFPYTTLFRSDQLAAAPGQLDPLLDGHDAQARRAQRAAQVDHGREQLSFELAPLEPHAGAQQQRRSEEHTSELQSRENLVCRLLLEKKKRQRE